MEEHVSFRNAPGKSRMRGQSFYFIFIGVIGAIVAMLALMDGLLVYGLIILIIDASFPIAIGVLGLRYGGSIRRAKLLRNFGIAAIIYFSLALLGAWWANEVRVGNFLALSASIWYFMSARRNLSEQDPNFFGVLSLEKGDWSRANAFFEQALVANPEDAKAYIGKLCAELRLNREEDLLTYDLPIDSYMNYQRAMWFASATYQATLRRYARTPAEQLEGLVDGIDKVRRSKDPTECRNLVFKLKRLSNFEQAAHILRELGVVKAYMEVAGIDAQFFDCPLCGARHTQDHLACAQCDIEFVKSA